MISSNTTAMGLVALLVSSLTVSARPKPVSAPAPGDDFFIVSSIDTEKGQLLLKRPTEVTELMRVNEATRYLDENGKPVRLQDLRAGDTVFVATKPGSGGSIAAQIHKGPMTLTELHKRYVR